MIAYVIDWLVLFAELVVPQVAIASLWQGWPLSDVASGWVAWGWVLLTVSLPSWLYFILSDSSGRGASVGKRLLRLAVRGDAGGVLSRPRALLRNAIKLLPWELTHVMIFLPKPIGETLTPFKIGMIALVNALMLIWLAVPLIRRDRLAVHDLAAGSHVVRAVRLRTPVATVH